MSVYQGDPAIKITADGATLEFNEGQPVMDKGYENAVLISLFTKQNWSGNVFFRNQDQRIGSDFEASMTLPINVSGLNRRRDAAIKALEWAVTAGLFQSVDVEVTNPRAQVIMVRIRITPPFGEDVNLSLSNEGASWRFQREDPAHRRFKC